MGGGGAGVERAGGAEAVSALKISVGLHRPSLALTLFTNNARQAPAFARGGSAQDKPE